MTTIKTPAAQSPLTYPEWAKIHAAPLTCDCGGPQYGTDHAPDCSAVLTGDDNAEDYDQYLYDLEDSETQ